VLASSVVNHDYNERLDSISGVITSVLASSVVNHDYKAGTRSQHTNNYTTDTVQPCNHDLPH
jgi:hypothetical protein